MIIPPSPHIAQAQRAGNDSVHRRPQVRRRRVPGAVGNVRHHHGRRHRDQPAADRRQRVPEARLRAATDSPRSRGMLTLGALSLIPSLLSLLTVLYLSDVLCSIL